MRSTPTNTYLLVCTVICTASLAFASCGDDDDDTTGSTDTTGDATSDDDATSNDDDATSDDDDATSDDDDATSNDDDATSDDDDATSDDDDATSDDDDATSDDDDATSDDDDDGVPRATEFIAINFEPGASATTQLAVHACAGLYNRELGGSVYVNSSANDQNWLDELKLTPKETVAADVFLNDCIADFAACVRYSYADQQILLPNILTVASVLDAVPLDTASPFACDNVVFDATVELKDATTRYLATEYVFENFADQTTGIAMLNPGYNTSDANVADPQVTGDMSPVLVDFVFARKLFVHYLVNGCVEGEQERELHSRIVNAGLWPTPVSVYGYNDSWLVAGGYLYEAHTLCLDSRNMGTIPSRALNLSFFATRSPPITSPDKLDRNPPQEVTYDPTKTYVAFVVGDGDNISFIMSTRKEWLLQRETKCAETPELCAPLTWSISPHLDEMAPDVLRWYYDKARVNNNDYFILPPSGHLYAYPGSLAPAEQDLFVAATEQDARTLGVAGVVHWEWAGTWPTVERRFLPKYATADGSVRGIFAINVPYLFDPFPSWPVDQSFSILKGRDGGKAALFRQREWRGISGADPFTPTPQQMADTLAAFPKGTVTWMYMTSDGGLNIENSFFELVKVLPEHVVLVSADAAAQLALDADAQ